MHCFPSQPPALIFSVLRSLLPALQDEAISAFSPTSPLGHGVLLPAPLAVGTVHSLPQVCAWGSVCPPPAWLRVKSQQRSPYEGSACASTLSLGQHLITPAPSSTYWTNSTLAPRKRVQRQQTELQGSLIPVEMVSARLSLGSGQGQQGINQPSLSLVTAETDPPLLPQQV